MVGLQAFGNLRHQFRQPQHGPYQRQFVGMDQQGDIAVRVVNAARGGQVEDAGVARVGVLDIIDGVFRRFPRGQLQVEFHLCGRRPRQEKVAAGVLAHFVHQFPQGDEIARALGGAHRFMAPFQGHHLGDKHRELLRVNAQGRHGGFHPHHMALVVGAPDVNDPVVAPALEFVVMIGDVRREVG